ncbi:MAG: hypothetical protein AAB792_02855 [Patescibacteria group bacterium]
MKTTYMNKRYDTEKMVVVGEKSHYNNGNYSGTTRIGIATDGQAFSWTNANGQDCYLTNNVYAIEGKVDLDGYNMSEEQETAAIKAGLIEIV